MIVLVLLDDGTQEFVWLAVLSVFFSLSTRVIVDFNSFRFKSR